MISDQTALRELRQAWAGVRALQSKVQRCLLASFAQGASAQIHIADLANDLPFVQAFAVLNQVLPQLRDEAHFQCRSIFLGSLMKASKEKLPWVDYDLVKEGVDRRNDIAHRCDIIPRDACWKYIDAIESELVAWTVIDAPPTCAT